MIHDCQTEKKGSFHSLHDSIKRTIDEVISGRYRQFCHSGEESWQPAVNIYSSDECNYIIVDIAGMALDCMNVEASSGELVISGERMSPQMPRHHGAARVLHMEIDHGKFCRKIKLPDEADLDAITAKYKNGLLTIEIPIKHDDEK
ncbi:MAG TPA: Hsp20/alpha crystallin family protein [Phycisphaerae bacterium]|nr:Hsp20/alpha crystallin family protein [Phycisphaerae bacterium]HPS51966.1 Hsp20/alpha crystallin family protein [Phycisphaerae bacterium]